MDVENHLGHQAVGLALIHSLWRTAYGIIFETEQQALVHEKRSIALAILILCD